MAQKEEVTYELLVYSGTRWEAQGVYPASGHHTAVQDAKSLAKVSTVKGVKVVKEYYDAKAGASRSLTIYEHKPHEPGRPAASKSRNTPNASHASKIGDVRDAGNEGPPKKGGSIMAVLVKILVSLLFSLAAALVVTQITSISLQGINSLGMLKKSDFLNLVFLFVFVITALALVTRILVGMKAIAPILRARPAAQPSPAKRRRDPRLTPSHHTEEEKLELVSEQERQEQAAEDEKNALEAAKRAEEEARNKAEEEAALRAEIDAQSELITMNAFTQDAFDVLQGDKSKQEAHTVFGLVLFLVGAMQSLRHQHKLPDAVANTVMLQALGSVGLSKERAEHFVQHTDEYLISNPRYSEMFQSGRAAMGDYLESNVGPRGALSDALTDWEKPKSKNDGTGQPVTVLFTDIAGSTAMTQMLGDEGAQEVVRAHNRIVREALQGFAGKEIKHTGDGIMASFPSASAGVEAAMEMQRRTQAHNATDPEHVLGLKIGLNTGEPIAEDDDLFGSTVQLAARIVDKASAGQVLVSGSVHGLCQGKKDLKFERFADLDMKGFDESVTVYTALWDPKAKLPEAPASAVPSSPPVSPAPPVEPKP
jgi:class 3 adenylate cyclase